MTQDTRQTTHDWHGTAVLIDEIQVLLQEAWSKFARLKGMIVPDPPDLKEPKPGE